MGDTGGGEALGPRSLTRSGMGGSLSFTFIVNFYCCTLKKPSHWSPRGPSCTAPLWHQ